MQGKKKLAIFIKLNKSKLLIELGKLQIRKGKKCRLPTKSEMVISFLCRNGQQDKIDETKLTELEKIRALDYNPTNNASESSINNIIGVPEQAN